MDNPDNLFLHTILEALGIKVQESSPDRVVMTMPVDERTRQPFGYLHGGASVVLAESAASMGTYLNFDPSRHSCFGTDINASHLKSKKDGFVTAVAVPQQKGKTQMVWTIDIMDEAKCLICVSRCTVRVMERRADDMASAHLFPTP